MDAPARPAPLARGSLRATPLAHLLVYARNKRLTGRIAIDAPGADGPERPSASIEFWRGRITRAQATPRMHYFGAVVYELGWIDAPTLNETLLELSKTKKRHGEILLARGAITRTQREDALAEQACRKVHQIFSFDVDSTFEFFEAAPGTEEPALELEPLAPLWRGIRDFPPEKSIRDVLERYGGTSLRMVNEAALQRVDFAPEERDLCDALASRAMNVEQMRAQSTRIAGSRVDLLVYLLLIGKCIEPTSEAAVPPPRPSQRQMPTSQPRIPVAQPSEPRISAAPAPSIPLRTATPSPSMPRTIPTPGIPQSGEVGRGPVSFRIPSAGSMPAMSGFPPSNSRMSTAPPAQLGPADVGPAGIAARASSIDAESYFELLGVTEGTSEEVVRSVYFRLAKSWHPDRLPAELAPFRVEVESIFAAMTRAYRTLTDPESRRAYLNARATGTGSPKRPRAEIIRDIEHSMLKHDFALAEIEARKLHDAEPDDAEALALVAWSQAQGGDAGEEALRASILQLDHAVNTDRYCERAYYYRGVLSKRVNNGSGAIRDFHRVLQINPKHIDAAREVRLFEMRAKKGSGEHALEAIGSLLRGKKK